MNKILELQQKAQSLQEKHQSDIDKKLEKGMKQIFGDTESTLSKKAQNLLQSISDTTSILEKAQSRATAEITQQIQDSVKTVKKAQDTTLQAVLTDQRRALESLQAKLQESTRLSEEIAKQSNLKTALISSNIALVSIACIALIFSIAMSVISYVKYMQIQDRNHQIARIDKSIQLKTQELADLYTQIYNINKKRK